MKKVRLYRKLKTTDLKEASDLIWRVFSEFEAPEYSNEGIENFRKFINVDNLKANLESENMVFFGCYLMTGKIIGLISMRSQNHISLLFVDKMFHRNGIAKDLFGLLKKHLLETCDTISSITVNSSPYAVNAYAHLGFTKVSDEQIKDGIRFIPMKYDFKE